MLCTKFGWNWPNDSRKEDKNVKSLWWQWRWQHLWWHTMEKFLIEKLTWAFSSGELKGVEYKVNCYMIVTWHRVEYSSGLTSFSHFHWVLHLASFQWHISKALGDLNSGSAVHNTNSLDKAMMIYDQCDR